MRIALLTGLGAGALGGFMHFYSLVVADDPLAGYLHYAPLLIFFAGIYYSIKRTSTVNFNGTPGFKDALKPGVVAAAIMAVLNGIGYFVALTHTDVRGEVDYMLRNNMSTSEISTTLGYINKQFMFDRGKFFAMEYFLMGFIASAGIAFIMKLKRTQQNP